MNQDMQDYSPLPPEYRALPPEETPPGPEYTPEGLTQPEEPAAKRRKLRFLLYAAFALVYLGLLFKPGGAKAPELSPGAQPVPPAATAAPAPSAEPSAEPTVEPSAEPTVEPSAEPEPAELECHICFFNFSAYHHGFVKLINTEHVVSAFAEIREINLDSVEWSGELTADAIAQGYFDLPDFDDSETYFAHMDYYQQSNGMPELELRVTLTTDTGEELVYTEKAHPEQGWSVNYWPPDYEPFWDGEMYAPDYFAVMSYESLAGTPDIRLGSYQDALDEPDAIFAELTIDGVKASDEGVHIVSWDETYNGRTYYYTTLFIPRPADAPVHGTAHLQICQKLSSFDTVWVEDREIEY